MTIKYPPKRAVNAVVCVLLTVIVGVTAGGCYGLRELEDLSLVTLLGIDKGKTDPLLVTALIAIPRRIRPSAGGGSEGGGGAAGKPFVVMSREGKSIMEALGRIDESLARDVTTIDTTYVILGEELAREDAGCILDVFTRNLDFRLTTLVAVCQGTAQEFLTRFSPVVETDPATYLVSLTNTAHAEYGTSPLVTAHEFVISSTTLESEPLAPYLVITRKTQEEMPPAQRGEKREGTQQKQSGQGGGEEEEVVAVRGAAVFGVRGGKIKMVGTLEPKETMAALIMRGELHRGNIEISAPGASGKQSVVRFHHLSSHPAVKRTGQDIEVTYRIRLTASLDETQGWPETSLTQFADTMANVSAQELETLLNNTVQKLKSYGSDVIHLGVAVRTKFTTWDQWEAFNWPVRFSATPVSFDVRVFVFTTGFTSTPPVPK